MLAIAPTINAQSDKTKTKELDTYIEQARQQWEVPGLAVAVVKDGKVLLAKGYGEKKLGSGGAVDNETVFNIGSTTKAFTAVAIGMLIDEGKMSWDDRVVDYMPAFQLSDPATTQSARVRDLLTHNLGLPNADYLWAATTDLSSEKILHQMRFLPPSYPLRGGYTYQNIMYLAAGQLIEQVSGEPWETFIQERIFKPLKMGNTYPNLALSQGQKNRSTPHAYEYGKNLITPIKDMSADPIAPAGAIWSCIEDMAKWVQCMLDGSKYKGGRLLKPETFAELFEPQVIVPVNQFYPTTQLTKPKWTTYGLGWFQHDYEGRAVDFHTGSLGGTIAQIGLIQEEGLGYYFLGNLDHAEVRHALMYKVFDVFGPNGTNRDWSTEIKGLYGSTPARAAKAIRQKEAKRKANTQPSLSLSAYTGTYGHTVWGEIEVDYKNYQLFLTKPKGIASPLRHWQLNTFMMTLEGEFNFLKINFQTVHFQLNAEGEVSALLLGGDEDYRFVRE